METVAYTTVSKWMGPEIYERLVQCLLWELMKETNNCHNRHDHSTKWYTNYESGRITNVTTVEFNMSHGWAYKLSKLQQKNNKGAEARSKAQKEASPKYLDNYGSDSKTICACMNAISLMIGENCLHLLHCICLVNSWNARIIKMRL